MKSLARRALTLALASCVFSASFASENIFYVLRSNAPSQITTAQNTLTSLKQHFNAINVLISQAYQVDENGMVWGYLDSDTEKFAIQHNMKIMVLVTNANFDKEKVHKFLADPQAQQRAIDMLAAACEKNHYWGVQLDFEMVPLNDRNALTHFFKIATENLHKQSVVVSYAVAPVVANNPQSSEFQKRLYANWEGAYDLKALGQFGDFITIMAYNQHGEGTTPGATAELPWVEETIKYVLQFTQPEKISLGIPTFSDYWYTGTASGDPDGKIRVRTNDIGYDQVTYLMQKFHLTLTWDDKHKSNYSIFDHNWLNEYLYVEDAASFKAKLDLAKKYNLRGISVFYLGIEDPKIWSALA